MVLDLVNNLLKVVEAVLGKLPDYDEKKREDFYKLRTEYEQELVKDFANRDDQLIDSLHDELLRFIKAFAEEISRSEIQAVPRDRNA